MGIDTSLAGLLEKYQKVVSSTFEHSFITMDEPDHVKCLNLIGNTTELEKIIREMKKLAVDIIEAETYDEAHNLGVQFQELYRQKLQYNMTVINGIHESLEETCNWIYFYRRNCYVEGTELLADLSKLKDYTHYAALTSFGVMTKQFNILFDEMSEKLERLIELGRQFLEREITKLELAAELGSPFFSTEIEDVAEINKYLVVVTAEVDDYMQNARDDLVVIYSELLKLPILNMQNIHDLEILKKIKNINDSRLNELVDNLEENVETNLVELIKESYNRVTNPTKVFTDLVQEVIIELQSLNEDLRQYKAASEMDTDFFM